MVIKPEYEINKQIHENERLYQGHAGAMNKMNGLKISKKLYGRQNEIKALTDAFQRVSKGNFELVLVKGSSGTGKTELINRTLRPLAGLNGFYITGKFEQFQRDEPYVPFTKAFRNLIRQILTEPDQIVRKWRKELIRVLGKNGKIIANIIPEIELIIGRQPFVEKLDPQKTKIRFQIVFKKFMQMFSKKAHPLVLFLDDMQWADSSSLQLLSDVCNSSQNSYLFIVCAYRDDEVKNFEELNETIQEIKSTGTNVVDISLTHLNLYDTRKLIADTLSFPEEKVKTLSEIFYRKTIGNPFFIKQLLISIYEDKYLSFNTKNSSWEWDTQYIQKLKMADNIVDLLIKKLKKLSEETVNVIKQAACIGSTFDLKTLSIICEKSLAETAAALLPLIEQGLILPKDDIEFIRIDCNDSNIVSSAHSKVSYEFLHDRVHQGAYALIPIEEKKEMHLKIGRLILENTAQDEINNKILNIMFHCNYGLDLIEKEEERLKLAKYNLMAGKKAKASVAYDSALKYFKASSLLLQENSWDKHYQLTYDLYFELSQCEYLCSNFQKAEQLFEIILANAKTDFETAEVYGLKTSLINCLGNYSDAVKVGIKALNYLGVKLPENPNKLHVIKEVILLKWLFRNKRIDDLINLPESNNKKIKKIVELLALLGPAANISANEDLFSLIILKPGFLSLKYGNTEFSSIGYVGYAIVTGSILGDYNRGHDFEKAALKLTEKYNNSLMNCQVYFTIGALVSHWTQHGKISVEYLNNSIDYGFDSGDLLFVGYSISFRIETKYILGISLESIYEDCLTYYDFAERMKFNTLIKTIDTYKYLIENLKDKTDKPSYFTTDDFEKQMLEDDDNVLMCYYILKTQIYYLFGHYEKALAIVDKTQNKMDVLMGYIILAECIFYNSLTITGVYDQLPKQEQSKYLKVLKRNQKKMKKWADNCSNNFLHKYLLISAEMTRLKGKSGEVGDLYDKAIKSASENGYTQNEAIANELAAKYYFSTGREKIAEVYINEAYRKYQSWGAEGKAEEIKRKYKNIIKETNIEETDDLESFINSFYRLGNIDNYIADTKKLDTVIKVFKSISEGSGKEEVFIKFLKTAIEIVGADKGYILFEENDKLYIEAFKESLRHSVKAEKHIDFESYGNIHKGIIRYVARTLETVMLDGNMPAGIFSRDPYIISSRPEAIICLPLLFENIFVGVLYLENNITTDVFTSESVEILKVLSYQMAYVKKLQNYLEKDKDNDKGNLDTNTYLIEPLTERELEVLNLISLGMSNKEIAASIEVKMSTVKTHIVNIYGKLGVNRRVQAVIKAKELEIIEQK